MPYGRVTFIELLVVAVSCAAAAACIPAGPAARIAMVVAVATGITCIGIWVWVREQALNAGTG